MRFDVITLFPELFGPHLSHGVTRRAFESAQVDVRLWQLRDFAEDNYRRVDDRPFGGGPGMVMLAEPLERALNAVKLERQLAALDGGGPVIIHFSPTGQAITQSLVRDLAKGPGGVLLCGRYEGMDQRFLDRHVTLELSLGDFVLSGGELPALALLDAIARLQDGVLNDAQSHQQDSFSDGLLDCPHYSRPEVLTGLGASDTGLPVPAVLMSGHHANIAKWRRERSLEITQKRRPELIDLAREAGALSKSDERFLRELAKTDSKS
ncbi:tRNA (guanosine(37)-N1)-methyltransferase TrmD [Paucibacter sp. TC2R-5]|uniref:tRNA (guanosine(37)-N1)-methyltransferase TrmD n=1 Tax=Paucibacter sp. TC2R-5 TaxID=2893555 RepID=UPI0021E43F54|nr:tRNA (guanosine(37)-N1)-methyltransferase TrmD [Paucibacter sp. TC2R-5]MCV2358804.1 tRNA (guanosine(37)-N1)-methyltransferase TrmD [Paucibacter sp. TC2R-5]